MRFRNYCKQTFNLKFKYQATNVCFLSTYIQSFARRKLKCYPRTNQVNLASTKSFYFFFFSPFDQDYDIFNAAVFEDKTSHNVIYCISTVMVSRYHFYYTSSSETMELLALKSSKYTAWAKRWRFSRLRKAQNVTGSPNRGCNGHHLKLKTHFGIPYTYVVFLWYKAELCQISCKLVRKCDRNCVSSSKCFVRQTISNYTSMLYPRIH